MIVGQELDKRLFTLKIIWFAMLLSLAIYLVVGLGVGTSLPALLPQNSVATFKIVLYLISIVTLLVTRYVRKFVLTVREQGGQAAQACQQLILQKYTSAMIVALFMSESIGVYGLVLFLLGRNYNDLYLLLLVSVIAMIVYRPRKADVLGLFQKSQYG